MTISIDTGREMYRKMYTIRAFEKAVERLFSDGEIPGFVHLYSGQEACAVGVCTALEKKDYITSTHRGHGHCIAKGCELPQMMAELFGRETGYNKGKGGSMHIASTEIGMLGANAITAAGMPIATGAALAATLLGSGAVAVAFFGDSASNQGSFHESINFAASRKLPVLYVCENNQFGVGTRITDVTNTENISVRAQAYGIPGETVDGQDISAVYDAASRFIGNARNGKGPALLELKTWRYKAHFQGEPASYRTKDEEELWQKKDPLRIARKQLSEQLGMTDDVFEEIESIAESDLEAAIEFARASKFPGPETAMEDVYAPRGGLA